MDGKYGVTGAVNAFHRHFPHNKSEDQPESLPARRGLFSIRRCFGYSSPTHDSSLVHNDVLFLSCARHQKCEILISSY
ncbi:unnamed protein product [Prunus armeniaca]